MSDLKDPHPVQTYVSLGKNSLLNYADSNYYRLLFGDYDTNYGSEEPSLPYDPTLAVDLERLIYQYIYGPCSRNIIYSKLVLPSLKCPNLEGRICKLYNHFTSFGQTQAGTPLHRYTIPVRVVPETMFSNKKLQTYKLCLVLNPLEHEALLQNIPAAKVDHYSTVISTFAYTRLFLGSLDLHAWAEFIGKDPIRDKILYKAHRMTYGAMRAMLGSAKTDQINANTSIYLTKGSSVRSNIVNDLIWYMDKEEAQLPF